MANLITTGLWEPGIYQLEVEDGPEGGAEGIDNVPIRQLANRAEFLNAARLSGYIDGHGRNLLTVLGVSTIAQAMAALRTLCNGTGTPDFSKLQIGDYLDLPSLNDGTTVYTWNSNYKNLRIVVSGFNHYKGAGDQENSKNHILFTFRNCVTTKRMNPTDDNTGGYPASELRTYLEGVFALGLKQAVGDYLYPVRRLLSTKGGWTWFTDTVFLPTEREVWGYPAWGETIWDGGTPGQYPIYKATAYKGKRHNGSRMWWWEASPEASSAVSFCLADYNISANYNIASAAGGVAPAFCVA